MKKMKKGRWKSYLEKKSRLTVVTYTVVRLLVVLVLVRSIFTGQLESVFTCLLTLFLLFLPAIVSRKLHMQLPTGLEITVILFIFAAEIWVSWPASMSRCRSGIRHCTRQAALFMQPSAIPWRTFSTATAGRSSSCRLSSLRWWRSASP